MTDNPSASEGPQDPFGPTSLVLEDGCTVDRAVVGMDPLEQLCRRIEIGGEEKGWDQRPTFYNISMSEDLSRLRLDELHIESEYVAAMVVSELMLPGFVYNDPGAGLLRFLQFLAMEKFRDENRLFAIMNRLVPVNFVAFAAMNEAWMLPQTVPLEERLAHSQGRTTQDHPDRIELRSLIVATVDGRTVSVRRPRGELTTYQVHSPVDEHLDGRVPTAVRLMCELFGTFDSWRRENPEKLAGMDVV